MAAFAMRRAASTTRRFSQAMRPRATSLGGMHDLNGCLEHVEGEEG
jgi:hypothetical protein